jgi:nitrite reductase/ring-hydroxylating ferredoxin subunit
MRSTRTVRVAVYERSVRASLERIWENVLDWEHLPGLHRDSFASIRCLDAGDWGFTAQLVGRGSDTREMTVRVAVEKDALRYVTATVEGPGKGTEIWTQLTPKGAHETDIHVEFVVPNVEPERVATLGDAYRRLYTQLWDEDEAMMQRREAWLARLRDTKLERGARLELGLLSDVRAKLPLVLELGGRPWRVVALGDELIAHSTLCPHWLGPLDSAPVENGAVECPWHRYRFDIRSGKSCDGRSLRLSAPPRVVVSALGHVSLQLD